MHTSTWYHYAGTHTCTCGGVRTTAYAACGCKHASNARYVAYLTLATLGGATLACGTGAYGSMWPAGGTCTYQGLATGTPTASNTRATVAG